MKKELHFSRLLKIFEANWNPAYIVELKDDKEKSLWLSYSDSVGDRKFLNKKEITSNISNKYFQNLSEKCLISNAKNLSFLFYNAPITHFKADCENLINAFSMFDQSSLTFVEGRFPLLRKAEYMFASTAINKIDINFDSLVNGHSMFEYSSIKKINSTFPVLESADFMFSSSSIENVNIDFPKLKNAFAMFSLSKIKSFSGNLDNLEDSSGMFSSSDITLFNSKTPKLKYSKDMFYDTSDKNLKNHPHYFV